MKTLEDLHEVQDVKWKKPGQESQMSTVRLHRISLVCNLERQRRMRAQYTEEGIVQLSTENLQSCGQEGIREIVEPEIPLKKVFWFTRKLRSISSEGTGESSLAHSVLQKFLRSPESQVRAPEKGPNGRQ